MPPVPPHLMPGGHAPGPGGPPAPGGDPGKIPVRVIGPKGLPPDLIADLRAYSVPADKASLHATLHKKYGQPGPSTPLKVVVKGGENTFDLKLP
jgi:hypothetical protein